MAIETDQRGAVAILRWDDGENRMNLTSMAEWHEVLRVEPQASAADIRDAYKRMLSQYHPDKVASLGTELRELASRKSQEITQAYRAAMTERGEPG